MPSLNLTLSRLYYFYAGILLWFVFDLMYRVYISQYYGYSGFFLNVSYIKYTEALVIYSSLLLLTPKSISNPSDFFITVIFFGLITPMLVLYGLNDQVRVHLYIALMGFLSLSFFRLGPHLHFPYVKNGEALIVIFLILAVVTVTFWLYFSGGFKYFNVDLTKVYEYRSKSSNLIDSGFMGYLNTWSYKVFGPTLIAFGLWKKKRLMVLFVMLLHVIWFAVSSHKAVLFYPFLVLAMFFFYRRSTSLTIIPVIISVVVLLSFLYFIISGQHIVPSMFIRRVFFVTANNAFDYYDFFSNNEFVYWSNSLAKTFIDYPYELPPPLLIGDWRNTDSHVNNTFLATGYMHAGVIGVFLYATIAGLVFRLVDSLANNGIPVWVAISILLVPSRSLLLSADLFTSLLTHGVGIGIVILFFIRSRNDENCSSNVRSSSL